MSIATPAAASRVPFSTHTHIDVLDAPAGESRVAIPDAPELANHLGTVHGGMLFTLGEVAAGSAMTHLLGADIARVRAITRRASIDYLRPARGAVTGEGRVSMTREEILAALEAAPSVAVPVAVALKDASGVVVATLAVEWFVGRPKPPA